MKILKNSHRKKNKGQAMVEFALALPILILIILGLMEAGRLLFIYGSVTTASREAVRYGSAIGDNGSGTPKHLDCDGIRTSAQDVGFLLAIESDDIDIQYENGNGTSIGDCNGASYNGSPLQNGDRISITVTGIYAPMVPMSGFATFPITTASKRTIFIGIKVVTDDIPPPPSANLSFTKTADPTFFGAVGDVIEYTFTLENTGDFGLTDIKVEDSRLGGTICSGISLAKDALPITCSATYTITDSDIATGSFKNTAEATASSGADTLFRISSVTVTYEDRYEITLEKTPLETIKTTTGIVSYDYIITNTGNRDLTNFSIQDNTDSDTYVTVCSSSTTLTPGATYSCTNTYNVRQVDLDADSVTNTATAIATDGGTNTATTTASATIITAPLTLAIKMTSPNPYTTTGSLTYSYELTNNLGGVMDSPILALDFETPDGSFIRSEILNCEVPFTTQTTCNGTYIIEQIDLDSGGIILVDAIASAEQGGETFVSTSVEIVEVWAELIPDLALSVSVSVKDGPDIPADNPIIPPEILLQETIELVYTYAIENIGNVTLNTPYEVLEGDQIICSGDFSDLSPGEYFVYCEKKYLVTQADRDAGSIISTAIAFTEYIGWDSSTIPTTSNAAPFIIYFYDGDRLTLEIISSSGDGSVYIGDDIIFTYTLKNTGSTILSAIEIGTAVFDYPINSNLSNHDFSNCAIISTDKNPGETIKECIIPYQVIYEDIINGNELKNIATSTAQNELGDDVPATASLSLELIELTVCTADQWTSSLYYQAPNMVYHCEGNTCSEWQAQQIDPEQDNIPGHAPPGSPAYWNKQNRCLPEHLCQVSLTNIDMSDNSSSHSLTIENNSDVSVEIGNLTFSWEKYDLTNVWLNGTLIYPGISSSNGGFTLPDSPWTVGTGNTDLVLSFSGNTKDALAVISFSDNLCSGTTLGN